MAPPSLHGLNVVQPVQPDSQDLAAPFPDFSAHLDLWTNLTFESDEPLAAADKPKRRLADHDDAPPPPLGLPNQDGHEDFPSSVPPSAPPLDFNALLAGFGIDPLLIPAAPPAPVQRNVPAQPHPVPSLAQLLALHAAHAGSLPVPPAPSATIAPSPPVTFPSHSPPSKRSRAHKSLSPTDNKNNADPGSPTSTAQSSEEPTQPETNTTALSAAEDKRRRNTAASARFRLKKKEREAALERRAKELEDRVVELERECEGLRRENGWLKGLVVGVTGAGAAQHQQASAK